MPWSIYNTVFQRKQSSLLLHYQDCLAWQAERMNWILNELQTKPCVCTLKVTEDENLHHQIGSTSWWLISCTCKCNQMAVCFNRQVMVKFLKFISSSASTQATCRVKFPPTLAKLTKFDSYFSTSAYEFYPDISSIMENLHMQLFTEFDVFNFEMKYSLFLALYFDAK